MMRYTKSADSVPSPPLLLLLLQLQLHLQLQLQLCPRLIGSAESD